LLISLLSGRKLINALKRWNIGQQIAKKDAERIRQTRTAHDGWIVDNCVGGDFDSALWHGCRASMSGSFILRHWRSGAVGFADDYLKAGKRLQPGLTGRQESFFSVDYRLLRSGCVVPLNQVLKYQVFMNVSIPFFKDTAIRTESARIPSGALI